MFPPEIIDHIFSFLQRDHGTLELCIQAHPTLSKVVERHLYAHLSIHTPSPLNFHSWNPGSYSPSRFLKITSDNPNIAKYVRSLQINLQISAYLRSFGGARLYLDLTRILPLLTELEAISLSSNHHGWQDMHDSFRNAFIDCLRLPNLTQVGVSNVAGFPLCILDFSGPFHKISLSGGFCSPPLSARPSLNRLVLHHCSSMDVITSWAEARSLHSLYYQGNFRPLSQLLQVCANSLTTLMFNVPHAFRTWHYPATKVSSPFIPIPLSLTCLPYLRRLMIQSSISFSQQFWVNSTGDDSLELRLSYSCLPGIMQLLYTLPSPPTELALLLFDIDIELDNSFDGVSEVDWSPLRSFSYFDVVSSVELRVRAQKKGKRIRSDALLDTLKQDSHLIQLQEHHSFLINAVEEPIDLDQL